MKKLFLSLAMLFTLFAGVQNTQAQERVYQERDRYYQNDRHRDRERYSHVVTRNEYRYVKYGSEVYKETYRCTYYRNGRLVNRQLIDRERVEDYYDNHKYKFNVFLRF